MGTIQYIRTELLGMTQAEMARATGLSQSSISRWECGASPSLEDLRAIRGYFIGRGLPWNDTWFFEPPVLAARREMA